MLIPVREILSIQALRGRHSDDHGVVGEGPLPLGLGDWIFSWLLGQGVKEGKINAFAFFEVGLAPACVSSWNRGVSMQHFPHIHEPPYSGKNVQQKGGNFLSSEKLPALKK